MVVARGLDDGDGTIKGLLDVDVMLATAGVMGVAGLCAVLLWD